MKTQTTDIVDGLKNRCPFVRDDEKIAPIVMDTVRPAGRTVGMESGTGDEERDGAWLQIKIRYNKLIFPLAAM